MPRLVMSMNATCALLLLLIAVLTPLSAEAQDRSGRRGGGAPGGVVEGRVVDAETEEGIPSATVALHAARDSSLVTGAITNADGTFAIENTRPGRYYVRVSYVGYASQLVSDVQISRAQREADLGTIALASASDQMDEVEVTAERDYVEVGIDKNTYNVKNQPLTTGGSALNVLETIPSVEVDIDDQISLRGSENVAIYLNGKPAPMSGEALSSFLAGLPADGIERVEVIPNPSARYEPEGMSGIINIVLATNQDRGWGGSVSASAGTRGRYNGSASAHYGSGPWSLFGSYSARYGQRDINGSRFRENRYLVPVTFLDQENAGTRGGLSHTLNTNADYQLSDKETVSLAAIFSTRGGDTDERNLFAELDAAQDPTLRYARVTDGTRSDLGMDYRLSYKRVVKPSENELSIEARYEQDWEDDREDYDEERLTMAGAPTGDLLEQQNVDEEEEEQEISLQADYVRPLGAGVRMEAGYKGELERLNSQFFSETFSDAVGAFMPDTDLNNRFTYDQQIHAAYGIVKREFGKFGTQVGLRAERALTTFDLETTGTSFDNNYFSFFPSAYLTFKPTERQTLKLSYSKRVNRPNTWQLNPFGDFDDPTSRRVGNPSLKPEYTHAFEFSATQLGDAYTLSLSPYYRYTVDAISWSQRLEDDVTITTFENFATNESYGAEVVASLRLGEWLRGNASFNAYQRVTDGSNVDTDLSTNAFGYSTRLSGSAQMTGSLTLQLSQFYRAPMDVPGGRIDAFTKTDLALRQELWGDRASLSLRASDVFDQMGFSLERESELYYQTFNRDFNAQGLQLSFQYTFGQKDTKRRGNRGDGGGDGGEEMEGAMP